MAAAHERGIVHRDIKSDNIMLLDGRVQIMDFGLVKLQGASLLTKAGSTIGTTMYMSPEQVQGLETDRRTDVFALGVVMYELLTGELRFEGSHEAAVTYKIVNVDPRPIHALRPDVKPDLDRIAMHCLGKDRETRYQSAREVASVKRLFAVPPLALNYDIPPDGKTFVVTRSLEMQKFPPLSLVVNWQELVAKK